jgi:methionyl-tRNA formyltransferase
MVMRLVFMGTPEFAVPSLQKLLGSSHQVVSVVTQSDKPAGRGGRITMPPVKKLALEKSISVHQPERLKSEEWQRVFEQLQAEAYVVVAYGKLLPAWLIDLPKHGAVNLHASLLPKYRGAAPINWAIANGEKYTGVTIMRIDRGLDTGDILIQEAVRISPEDTASDLHDRLAQLGADLMLKTLDSLETGLLTPIAQRHELASYAPLLKKADGLIDWTQSSTTIHNRVRGFNPWPGTYTCFRGTILRVWKARLVDIPIEAQTPGTLIRDPRLEAVVFCGQGQLQLLEIQPENRKHMTAAEFLNGIRLGEHQTILLGK